LWDDNLGPLADVCSREQRLTPPCGSPFRPSGSLLPRTILLAALWASLVAAPVARLKIQDTQTVQVFLKDLANESGPVHLLLLGCHIGGFQELCIEKNGTIFIVAFRTSLFSLKVGSI
jgi:hypothetical protein